MVKVWYQPPPYGPRTSLNRPAYGNGGDLGPRWVVQISKMPPGRVIAGFIAAASVIAYIPLSKFTDDMLFSTITAKLNYTGSFLVLWIIALLAVKCANHVNCLEAFFFF